MLLTGYDLRGILSKDLTYELIEKTIQNFIKYLKETKKSNKKILLAVDPNQNNFKVINFIQKKFNFNFLGLLPTPIFYFQVIQKKTPGIMITASHLPLKYSGIKFLLEDGNSWKPDLKKIRKFNTQEEKFKDLKINFTINQKIFEFYFEKLSSIIKPKNKILVNFDLKNFFLNSSLPYFKKLKIFHSSESQIKVKSDLDNDRLYFFYKNKLIPSDIIFYFLSLNNQYQKLGVPIFFSQALKEELLEKKKEIFIIPTGHYYFKKAFKKYNIDLAFEPSGHFYFFKDLKTEAPYLALVMFLVFLSDLENKKLFQEIFRRVKIYRFNLNFSKSGPSLEKIVVFLKSEFGLKLLKKFDGYLLGDENFYIHLRKSKTENKLRVSFEGEEKYLKVIKKKIKSFI